MCYSTTKGTARKPMSFPGVVKPLPWPGLAPANSIHHPAMAGPLWANHHHHQGSQAPANAISDSISASTHVKVLPQSRSVNGKRPRDVNSPTSVTPSPMTPTQVVHFEGSVPVSTEPLVAEPSPKQVQSSAASSPPEEGVGSGTNEDPAGESRSLLSPTVKKAIRMRRKCCGTCVGCTRKENCGTCSVCTNPNTTNSVCKLKRCEDLKNHRVSDIRYMPTGRFHWHCEL